MCHEIVADARGNIGIFEHFAEFCSIVAGEKVAGLGWRV